MMVRFAIAYAQETRGPGPAPAGVAAEAPSAAEAPPAPEPPAVPVEADPAAAGPVEADPAAADRSEADPAEAAPVAAEVRVRTDPVALKRYLDLAWRREKE